MSSYLPEHTRRILADPFHKLLVPTNPQSVPAYPHIMLPDDAQISTSASSRQQQHAILSVLAYTQSESRHEPTPR
eukprot:2906825-Rhodomonas_salina.6